MDHYQTPGIASDSVAQLKLSVEQQQSLRMKAIGGLAAGLIPALFVILTVATLSRFAFDGDLILLVPLFIVLFAGIVISFTMIWAGKTFLMFQDAKEGIVLRQVDMLEKTYRIRGKSSTRYYGNFRQIGQVIITYEQYIHCIPSMPYQVIYSPRSKHIWEIKPINPAYQQEH